MDKVKKHRNSAISPFIETQSLRQLAENTGNLYKALNVISKRANQIGVELKDELHSKLEEFATTSDNLEEVFENREQIEISRYYEKLPHPTLLAMQEYLEKELHYRSRNAEEAATEETK